MRSTQAAVAGVGDLGPAADVRAEALGRGVHQHLDLVGRRDAADARAHELGGVALGSSRGRKRAPVRRGSVDAVEAEAAPVVAVQVVGHEVPAAAERDEPVRLGQPGRPVARLGGVAELEALVVAAGLGERGEDVGVEGRARVPRGRHGDRAQRLDPAAQARRHHLHHLRQRPDGGLLDRRAPRPAPPPACRRPARRPPRRRRRAGAARPPRRAGSRPPRRGGRRPGSRARGAGRRRAAACARDTPSRSASSGPGQKRWVCSSESRRSVRELVLAMFPVCRQCGQKVTAGRPRVLLMTERDDLLESLTAHRGFLRHTVQGITDEQARQRLTVSELTLGGLIKHVAKTEKGWADFVVDGPQTMAMDEDSYAEHADGFVLREDETLADVLADYEKIAAAHRRARAHLATSTPSSRCPRRRGSRRTPPARRAGCSCTSWPRPRSTRATPTSSARPSTARRRWGERGREDPDPHDPGVGAAEPVADVRRRHRGAGARDAHGQRALPRRDPQARHLRRDDLGRLHRRRPEGPTTSTATPRASAWSRARRSTSLLDELRRGGEAHRGGDHRAARPRDVAQAPRGALVPAGHGVVGARGAPAPPAETAQHAGHADIIKESLGAR